MDRKQLRYFVAIADHGGFVNAADELGVAQPTLSQAIAALERALGAQLFHRLGRGVRLSAAGEALLDPARRVLRDFTTAEDAIANVRGLTGGYLDIATIPTLVHPLADLIGSFRRRYPGVIIRSPELDAGETAEATVASGVCELGLTELPTGIPGLAAINLSRQPFHLVLPPGSRQRPRYPLDRFDQLQFVATPAGTSSRARLDEAAAHSPSAKPSISVETGHRDALIPLVLAGAGAAFLPEPMADDAKRLGATVMPTSPIIGRQFGLIHRNGPLSAAATAFVNDATSRTSPSVPNDDPSRTHPKRDGSHV